MHNNFLYLLLHEIDAYLSKEPIMYLSIAASCVPRRACKLKLIPRYFPCFIFSQELIAFKNYIHRLNKYSSLMRQAVMDDELVLHGVVEEVADRGGVDISPDHHLTAKE